MQAGSKKNTSPTWACKEEVFWRGVSTSTVRALQESWAYGPDFLLFQYSANEYFGQIRKTCEKGNDGEEGGEETH